MPKTSKKGALAPKQHIPVLAEEVLSVLQPKKGESFLDLTAGYGGHAQSVLDITKAPDGTALVDRDESAISSLKQRFKGQGVQIIHKDFLSASQELAGQGRQFNMVLADLGISSPHLDQGERGFSIKNPGPLDMRMDQSQELTAGQIVNDWPEEKLQQILRQYGQEPKAREIARKIVRARPIDSTEKLAAIIKQVWWRRSKIHPATRTFQALRIAVNDELAQLENSLPLWQQLLAPGGRLAIISFHSLEDRIVKRFFAENAAGTYDAELRLLTKKPLTPNHTESDFNPRARSAKLRAAAKINTKRKG